MKIQLIKYLLFCLFFLYTNCKDDSNDIQFILKTRDIEGNYRSTFKSGENIIFEFMILNSSLNDFIWPNDECRLLNTEEFLLIYKIDQNHKLAIGKPHITPVYCNLVNLPDKTLPPGEHVIVEMSWKNTSDDPLYAKNELLEVGEYWTGFQFTLSNNSFSFTTEVSFSITN